MYGVYKILSSLIIQQCDVSNGYAALTSASDEGTMRRKVCSYALKVFFFLGNDGPICSRSFACRFFSISHMTKIGSLLTNISRELCLKSKFYRFL